ncbi:MAG TPA: hypothetical protein PKK61_02080 [Defluviitaleaceae bacterium]|jgi:hypothetical protein|nr:hypothetical protein [Defluviitaleaceae bacterium]
MTVQGARTTTKDNMMNTLRYGKMELDEVNKCYKYMLDY